GLNRPVPVPTLPGQLPPIDGTPRATAPLTGQHTRAILAEHGYGDGDIDALLAQGTVAAA
ncbi:MAG: CoA transferase, partial [Reyranella sp.]